jgi:hypothetical protein
VDIGAQRLSIAELVNLDDTLDVIPFFKMRRVVGGAPYFGGWRISGFAG